ncbi:CPBP family glutamic-type intramembrane protease [Lactobacillus gallinarum]
MQRPIYAAALGLVLAILYLYTGKLWLPMLLSLWR